jgi:hypothetical protein|tara:strand:+ start:965 stop:1174 length:210 start_codon:yes stop_codon:yes gene_type:complete
MKEQCKQAIYSYVDAETQLNAALTGEHSEYVEIVLTLLRSQYSNQIEAGETTFTVPTEIHEFLTNECPW